MDGHNKASLFAYPLGLMRTGLFRESWSARDDGDKRRAVHLLLKRVPVLGRGGPGALCLGEPRETRLPQVQ